MQTARELRKTQSLIFDLGTSRIAALLLEKVSGSSRILRYAQLPFPEGFQKGEVTHLEKAVESLTALIDQLHPPGDGAELLELPAYVLLSSPFLKMACFTSSLYFGDTPRTVTSTEIGQAIEQTRSVAPLALEDWILQAVPETFWVDDHTGVEDPTGLEAHRLAVTLQIHTLKYSIFRNLSRLFENLEISVRGYYAKGMILPTGVLTEDEKDEALIVHFSESATHLVLVREGKLSETKSLDWGSGLLAQQITSHWQIGLRDARRLYEQFGTLEEKLSFPEELIPLIERKGTAPVQIKRCEFHQAFQGFAGEALGRLTSEIQSFLHDAKAVSCRMILTGSGAKLEGLLEKMAQTTGLSVRLGQPRYWEGAGDLTGDPSWAALIGFIPWHLDREKIKTRFIVKENLLARTLLGFRNWLVAYF